MKLPLQRLRKTVRRLVRKDQPLSPILEALHLPADFTGTTDERRKARVLVQALQDVTMQSLIEQAHLFPFDTPGRLQALEHVARSLWDNHWHPQGITSDDVDLIGFGLMTDVMWATATGQGVNALEAKIHELYRLSATGAPLPALRPFRDGRERTRLEPRSRRGVRQS